MMRTGQNALLSALVVASGLWLAPAASAAALAPSGAFVTNAGSRTDAGSNNVEVGTLTRFNDFQRALRLSVEGQEALDRGAAGDAEALDEQALPLFERALGPEDLRIVGPLASLADVYRMRGKLDRAELLYRRLAFLMEKAFGPSDIRVADALASAAEAVVGQGHQGQAKELYARALAIRQAAVGPDSPKVLPGLSGLADGGAPIAQLA